MSKDYSTRESTSLEQSTISNIKEIAIVKMLNRMGRNPVR